jgi:hypothetical protein
MGENKSRIHWLETTKGLRDIEDLVIAEVVARSWREISRIIGFAFVVVEGKSARSREHEVILDHMTGSTPGM